MDSLAVNADRIERVRAALSRRVGSVVAVCEAVRRRHNVSAILRSCEAFGVHEVHLVTQGFRPSAGAARGAERWVWRRRFDTVDESVGGLRARGFRVFVADLDEAAFTPETVPVDRPLAVVFGSEVRGVSDEARALADGAIRVPMLGLTESLNVSVSAAIVLRALADRRRALAGNDLDPAEQERFVADWLAAEERALRGLLARTAPVGEAG
ncbi:MAG: RNA methyltransferase [Deltaproteobacteria bacterium]|nr:RNA methyltransferase [Deltaproteobacteria bacterium]